MLYVRVMHPFLCSRPPNVHTVLLITITVATGIYSNVHISFFPPRRGQNLYRFLYRFQFSEQHARKHVHYVESFVRKRERATDDAVNPRRNQNQNTNAPPAMTRIQGAVAIAQMASGVVSPEFSKLLLELASQIVGAPAKERAGQIVYIW
jgi:hypothetical protein